MQSLSYFLYGFDIILSIVIIAAAHVYKIVHDSLTNQGFENRNMLSLFFCGQEIRAAYFEANCNTLISFPDIKL